MKTFNEYLNSKGQVEDGKVDIHGDRVDPMTPPNSPPKGKPYMASNGKDKTKKSEKGFGDQGDKDLIYEPDVKSASKKAADIPTAEFAQYELVPLISECLEKNPFLAENIVRDLKKKGMLGLLVGELMEHRETYKHLASIMGHKQFGEQICQKLVRAMREEISPPFGANQDDESPEVDLEQPGHDDVEVDDDMMDFDMAKDDSKEGDNEIGHGDPCPICQGQEGDESCELCHGTGIMDSEEDGTDLQQPPTQPSSALQNFQRAMMKRF